MMEWDMSYVTDPRFKVGLAQPVRGYGRWSGVAGAQIIPVAAPPGPRAQGRHVALATQPTVPPAVESGMPGWFQFLLLGGAVVGGAYLLSQASKSARRSKDVRFGNKAELEEAVDLVDGGAREARLSLGSRGAFDVAVDWSNTTWVIQMKASRRGRARMPRPAERRRLIRAAKRRGARPILGLRHGNRPTEHLDARTLSPVNPPRR